VHASNHTEFLPLSGGEHLGTAHLFLSVASGSMRLQVRRDQVEQARAVIAAFERGDFALGEDLD